MRDQEVVTTLNKILDGQWEKTDGTQFKHWDLWDEVLSLARERDLKLRMAWVQKRENMEMDRLEERVKDAALERENELSQSQLSNSALPPKNPKPTFEPVEGYEEPTTKKRKR
jgi:hypothetical protein